MVSMGSLASMSKEPEVSHAEGKLIAWMLADSRARQVVKGRLDEAALARLPLNAIFRAIFEEPDGPLNAADVIERLAEDWQRTLVSKLAVDDSHEPVDVAQLESRIDGLLAQLGVSGPEAARRRKTEVDRLMAEALRRGDNDEVRKLVAEAHQLGRAIHS